MDKKKRELIPHKPGIYEKYIKRPQDFILSVIAIIVLSPVLVLIAVLVRIKPLQCCIFRLRYDYRKRQILLTCRNLLFCKPVSRHAFCIGIINIPASVEKLNSKKYKKNPAGAGNCQKYFQVWE